MPILTPQHRNILEAACAKGRRASEQAVRAALTSLAVTAERPPTHLNENDRQLRRGLRAKARQLGDVGDNLDLLVAECAYEQWHHLLFARFLAENNLLIHPEYRAPLTLDDCEELAESLGEPDGWAIAARFAAQILPGIFRLDDPCVRMRLAPEGRLSLESIIADLPTEVFACDDALGWVYQFWQKDKKDEVNAAERKISGPDLGPITQLFTENYMVRFLLENSLGAWWAARYPDSPLVKTFDYLRFDEDGTPAAGSFEGWPTRVADVTVMDPCCGSGHFLVEAFSMLWQMRAEEEGLSLVDAQDAVLRENLFGLEFDPRCVQIAAFAVALYTWKTSHGWRQLPSPNIACTGIPISADLEGWTRLAGDDFSLKNSLSRLHYLFRNADSLGSLIDPRRAAEVSDPSSSQRSFEDTDWAAASRVIELAARKEIEDPAIAVLGSTASSLARAADYLGRRYVLVITNVPYLSRTKQGQVLRAHADADYPRSKHDLATMMLERLIAMSDVSVLAVLPQGWTQLSRYKALRERILSDRTLRMCAFLGPGAFSAISGEVVNAVLLSVDVGRASSGSTWAAIDVAEQKGPQSKAQALRDAPLLMHEQATTAANPDGRIVPEILATGPLLAEHANSLYGLRTGDGARLIRKFWELGTLGPEWRFHQSTTVESRMFAGREHILRWDNGQGALSELAADGIASLQGEAAWGHDGVVVSLMGALPVTRYTGESFDNNCAVVWPKRSDLLPALWACLSDESFAASVRRIDRSLKVTNQTLLKVPFDVAYWQQRAEQNGPLAQPSSDDPTQWLFTGRPESSATPLHVAVARLVGYRWPMQPDSDDLDVLADADGIACLPAVSGEAPAGNRVQHLLAAAFGHSWSPAMVTELLGATGGRRQTIDDWLRNEFFRQHCSLFENRPFIWHIWDGRRDGFAALVNYHQLDKRRLEKLTYTYLGDWIERQRAEVRDAIAGAEARLAAASKLRKSLELILDGEPPYDIYIRWKSLAEQAIGWDPDLNDGVRMNVRPFVEAGILRSSFNIHWRKDRGKNADGSERLNDCHLTTAEKRASRGGSV